MANGEKLSPLYNEHLFVCEKTSIRETNIAHFKQQQHTEYVSSSGKMRIGLERRENGFACTQSHLINKILCTINTNCWRFGDFSF